MRVAPIDELLEILKDPTRPPKARFDGADRQSLSYMLGVGAVKPSFLIERTGVDRAGELAEEVAEAAAAELDRRRNLREKGRAPAAHGRVR